MSRDFDSLYADPIPVDIKQDENEFKFSDDEVPVVQSIGPANTGYIAGMVGWLTVMEDELLLGQEAAAFSPESRIAKIELIRLLKNKIQGDLDEVRSANA